AQGRGRQAGTEAGGSGGEERDAARPASPRPRARQSERRANWYRRSLVDSYVRSNEGEGEARGSRQPGQSRARGRQSRGSLHAAGTRRRSRSPAGGSEGEARSDRVGL